MHTPEPQPLEPLNGDEAELLMLYRRMRRGQKNMFRELAELLVNRDPQPGPGAPPGQNE